MNNGKLWLAAAVGCLILIWFIYAFFKSLIFYAILIIVAFLLFSKPARKILVKK